MGSVLALWQLDRTTSSGLVRLLTPDFRELTLATKKCFSLRALHSCPRYHSSKYAPTCKRKVRRSPRRVLASARAQRTIAANAAGHWKRLPRATGPDNPKGIESAEIHVLPVPRPHRVGRLVSSRAATISPCVAPMPQAQPLNAIHESSISLLSGLKTETARHRERLAKYRQALVASMAETSEKKGARSRHATNVSLVSQGAAPNAPPAAPPDAAALASNYKASHAASVIDARCVDQRTSPAHV